MAQYCNEESVGESNVLLKVSFYEGNNESSGAMIAQSA
jgi:hypothetical protein